jgi:hypothetical protein
MAKINSIEVSNSRWWPNANDPVTLMGMRTSFNVLETSFISFLWALLGSFYCAML